MSLTFPDNKIIRSAFNLYVNILYQKKKLFVELVEKLIRLTKKKKYQIFRETYQINKKKINIKVLKY